VAFKVPEDMVGQWVQCPTCGLLFTAETLPVGLELVPAAELDPPLRAVPRRPQHPAYDEPQSIQVNTTVVNEQAPPVSTFAVASMVVSVLAFFFCWVPSIGFFLGGLALLLGCCALWAVCSRGQRGAGYAVAGIVISLVPVGISGYLTLQLLPKSYKGGGLLSEVTGHRFWSEKPTEAQVEKLVEAIASGAHDDVVFVDDQCHFERVSHPVMEAFRRDRQLWVLKPESVGKPYFIVDLADWSTRPSRAAVLARLKEELDRAEFRRPAD
jgi:hypothetical protein